MYPAQIYVIFQNMTFWGKCDSTTFNHHLYSHAKFWEQKILQYGLARYPTCINALGLNGIFFQKIAKIILPNAFAPWILKKLRKKLLEWIKQAVGVIFIH